MTRRLESPADPCPRESGTRPSPGTVPAVEALLLTGRVRTFDPLRPWADAVAVRGDRIVAVGSVAECRAALPASTDRIDGAAVLPGFTDAHVHPLFGGLDLVGCNLHDADDADGYLRLVDGFARAHPQAPWITGGGWALPAFPGGLPTAGRLDTVTGGRPAYLVNTDRHGAWVNTAALRAAGIDAGTPDPPDGRIERAPDGSPTGMLHEGAATLVASAIPTPSPADLRHALLAAQRYLHAQGITAWQDAIVGDYLGYPDALPVYTDLAGRGELTGAVDLALWWDRGRGPEQLADLASRRTRIAALADPSAPARPARLRAGTVKIMVDGIVENCSAALHAPYLGRARPTTGTLFVGGRDLARAVTAADGAGFSVHLHAIGDRAVTQALDALQTARAGRRPGATDGAQRNRAAVPRHHIAHLQLVAPGDISRFAGLDVTANLQMLWAAEDEQVRTLCRPLLGDDRVDAQYPFGDLHRAGVPLAAGSDWPVTTASVLAQVQVAVTRRPPGSPRIAPLGAHQALDVDTALAACTVGGAALHGRDATLRPGTTADLVVLGADPYRESPDDIANIPVTATVGGSRVVHRIGR